MQKKTWGLCFSKTQFRYMENMFPIIQIGETTPSKSVNPNLLGEKKPVFESLPFQTPWTYGKFQSNEPLEWFVIRQGMGAQNLTKVSLSVHKYQKTYLQYQLSTGIQFASQSNDNSCESYVYIDMYYINTFFFRRFESNQTLPQAPN